MSMLGPGLASDLKSSGISQDDMNVTAGLFFEKQVRPTFNYTLGLTYSSILGIPAPLPVIGFNWNDGNKWSVEGYLPVSLTATFAASNKFSLDFAALMVGNQYQADPNQFSDGNALPLPDPKWSYIGYGIGPRIRYQVADSVELRLGGGWTLYHQLQLRDGDDEVNKYEISPGPYFVAGVTIGG